ncbi:MAG: Uncharacterised protein [Synechococcus sp. CC9902]|nr:MAG: Uncharacterised protein [Synechococcus sp. CC9902]
MAGADVLVGVAFDAWGEAQHQPGRFRISRYQCFEPVEIVLVVDHHGDFVVVSEEEFLVVLVVAVQHHPFTGHPPLQCREQFARRNGIKPQSLRSSDAAHQQ